MQKIRLYLIGVAAVVLLGPVESSFSQCPEIEPEGEFKDIPVCITLDPGLGVGADGAEYCDSKKNKITANVGRNRNIVLSVGEASGRTLFLDLSGALSCPCSTMIDIEGADDLCDASTICFDDVPFVNANLSDVGFARILGENLDDLALGCTHEDNARLFFTVGEDNWLLKWGPYERGDGNGYCPGSGPVTVTRTGDNDWSFETTGDHLACLYRQENPPHEAKEYHGQFFVPFSGVAHAINMDQIANSTACIPQECRDRRNRLAVPTSCDVIGPCGTCGDGNCDPGEDQCNCDADCGAPPVTETACADGIDNDCDGFVDCDDGDCSADPACAFCGDGNCDPGEDQCNCDADCGTPPVTETACADGIDNDCDGSVDCDDQDCSADQACACAQKKDPCLTGDDCCSGACKRNGTCR